MNITIKPNSYYKLYYDYPNSYSFWRTDTTQMYKIAQKTGTYKPLIKFNTPPSYDTIEEWNNDITKVTIEEISKEDLFLELL